MPGPPCVALPHGAQCRRQDGVLLIEAGGKDNNWNIHIPLMVVNLLWDEKYTGPFMTVAVPFNGEGQALPPLLGNHVSYMFLGAPVAGSAIASGDPKALAVTSKNRSSLLPDIPTIQESSMAGFDVANWWGVFGPAGMPSEMVNNKAFSEIIQGAGDAREAEGPRLRIDRLQPEEFGAYVEAETRKWADIIKSEGLAPEQN